MSSPHSFLRIASLLLLTSGCAFTSEVIRIEPVTAKDLTAVPGAEAIVVQLNVTDLREEPTQVVARKINGYGMQLATISSDEPIVDVLGRAMSTELKALGYRIAKEADTRLMLELIVFSHEFRTGFFVGKSQASVVFLATVRDRDGREVFRQVIFGPFEHEVALAGGANVKKAFEGALGMAAARLVSSEAFQRALKASIAPPVL